MNAFPSRSPSPEPRRLRISCWNRGADDLGALPAGSDRVYVDASCLGSARDGDADVVPCISPWRLAETSAPGGACFTSGAFADRLEEAVRAALDGPELLVGPYLATACRCDSCRAVRQGRSWPDFHRGVAMRLATERIVGPARSAGARATLLVPWVMSRPFPDAGPWASLAQRFDSVLVEYPMSADPAALSFVLRWFSEILGKKVRGAVLTGGADSVSAAAAEAVAGGASEICRAADGGTVSDLAPRVAAGLEPMAESARRTPLRGVALYLPPVAPFDADPGAIAALRRLGIPVRPTPRFPASSRVAVLTAHMLADRGWAGRLREFVDGGAAAHATSAAHGSLARDAPDLAARVTVVPDALLDAASSASSSSPADGIGALRRALLSPLGVSLDAPPGVAFSLFGPADAVLLNHGETPARAAIRLGARRLRAVAASDPAIDPGAEAEAWSLAPGGWVVLRG